MNRARNFPPSPAFAALARTLATQIADLECSEDQSDEATSRLGDAFDATEKGLTLRPVECIGDLLMKVEILAAISEDSEVEDKEWQALARDVVSLNGPGIAFNPEAWLRRWTAKGGGYVRTDCGLSFVAPEPTTFQQRLLLDELQRAEGQKAVAAVIDGSSEPVPVDWATLRGAFAEASDSLPEEASEDELADYWQAWKAAMLGEAESTEAIRWKIAQLVSQTAETGEFSDDEELMDAIMADVARHAQKGGDA